MLLEALFFLSPPQATRATSRKASKEYVTFMAMIMSSWDMP